MLSQETTWHPDGRTKVLDQLKSGTKQWDMIVVGGGITGAGIYREAARLGLNVLLVEQQDFAWGTSSRSSKMVHGGLRYLGSGQLSLANDSVKERQNLMKELPGLVNPLPFVMGHYNGVFPGPWIFNKLLAVYDFMAGQRYRKYVNKGIRDFLVPGMNTHNLKGATQFSDAVTDDSRLVMRVLHDGNADGGTAINYVKAVDTLKSSGFEKKGGAAKKGGAEKVSGLKIEDQVSGEQFEMTASIVINATGTWTDELRRTLGQKNVIRPLRGSHLIVPFWRLPSAFSVSFFHAKDKRPVFVFPWEGVTVIGTTDLDHQQNSSEESSITQVEVDYLLDAANAQFPEAKLLTNDVRASWSGVRPVVSKNQDEATDASKPNKPSDEKREHAVWDEQGLISVAGGKLTTYRLIALDVLQKAAPYVPALSSALEQGARGDSKTSHFKPALLTSSFIQLSSELKKRLLGRYGHHTETLLSHAKLLENDFKKIGSTDTLWAELSWSCQHESIQHLDDLLLRRTRIGLLLENGAEAEFHDIKGICQKYLAWDDVKWVAELKRYQGIIKKYYSLPKLE
jgi:glycerol-3-phosphate dehydrogenase